MAIRTDSGRLAGISVEAPGRALRIFKGIPYARPPVGELRWRPPQPAKPWSGVRDCTRFATNAAQSTLSGLALSGGEDCLYLSVVTPARGSDDRLPVMVWLHGGGYTIGSGNTPRGHSPRLPQHGVVIVNVNMRLGILGLLAHPLLSAESPRGCSGNYMFLDMIAALRWIQANIAAFGGDPDNVTIFGQSGGGAKVANLMCSPLAAGLFHKAICQSGTSFPGFFPGKSLEEMQALGERLFRQAEVKSLEQARALPWQELVQAAIAIGLIPEMDTAVEGWFMPDFPHHLLAEGRQHSVPLIACANLGEVTEGAATYVFPTLIPGYLNMLRACALAGVAGYACIFDQVPAGWRRRRVTAIHAMELTYVYGDWDDSTAEWGNTHVLAQEAFGDRHLPRDPGLTEADRRVSEAMMRMWSRFAQTGHPALEEPPVWPVWSADADEYLYITDPPQRRRGFSSITLHGSAADATRGL